MWGDGTTGVERRKLLLSSCIIFSLSILLSIPFIYVLFPVYQCVFFSLPVDGVILDLEDAVAPNAKPDARNNVLNLVKQVVLGFAYLPGFFSRLCAIYCIAEKGVKLGQVAVELQMAGWLQKIVVLFLISGNTSGNHCQPSKCCFLFPLGCPARTV